MSGNSLHDYINFRNRFITDEDSHLGRPILELSLALYWNLPKVVIVYDLGLTYFIFFNNNLSSAFLLCLGTVYMTTLSFVIVSLLTKILT